LQKVKMTSLECIPHLTIYILDLTLEGTKLAEDKHDKAGDTTIEIDSGGVTMSGKRPETYKTCAVFYG